MERHHIIPRCMDGNDAEENLIYLYAQEHYYAHKLLAEENPNNKKLQLAWWNMCQCPGKTKQRQDNIIITADEFAQARESAALNSTGDSNPFYGKHHSDESKRKMSKSHKGKIASDSTKQKMSKVRKGKQTGKDNPMYGKRGELNPFYNHIHTESTRQKMREHHHDVSGSKNPRAIKVICVETQKIFGSASEAGKEYNITGQCILDAARGKQKTAAGLHWEFV